MFHLFKTSSKRCSLLLLMSYLTSGFLILLNFYIAYLAFQQFKGDGWSFLGGLAILISYMVTIPALIFSFLQIRMVKYDNDKKHLFPIIFGIIGILMGSLLYNAISWWFLIVLFDMLLIISSLICEREKQIKENVGQSHLPTEKLQYANGKVRNTSFRITVTFQIIGLVLLFLIIVSIFFSSASSDKYLTQTRKIIYALVFGFLFVLHGMVTLAFVKKKKWALKFKYIENYILLGITVLIFLAAIITDGISLTNTFFATALSFSLLILLFIYLIRHYKKLKKSNLFFLLFISLFIAPNMLPAQEIDKVQEITLLDQNDFNPYIEFYSTDITDYFNPDETSKYPSTNLFDGYLRTCWVAGSVNKNKRNILYIKVPDEIFIDKLIFNIFSGYGKSKKLYNANARPKKIKISILAAYNPDGYITEVAVEYLTEKYPTEKQIVLADTFGVQSFPLNLNKKDLIDFQSKNLNRVKSSFRNDNINLAFILKLEITDVYKGSKYDDICISELFFNNRFVTTFPDRYNQTDSIYVENNDILFADYADKKGVIIYEDTTSVFTAVDWENHSNWAILHYVKNDEVGQNSRIEESYLLIDLKNRKIVNNEFENCTGISIFSPVIEKNENGETFIDTFGKYKVELK